MSSPAQNILALMWTLPCGLKKIAAPASLAIAALALPAHAQTTPIWVANNGDYSEASNWFGGMSPTTSTYLFFGVSYDSPNPVIDIAVSGTAANKGFSIGYGKTVNMNMAAGSTFSHATAADANAVGANVGTGTGAAHLAFNGPATGPAATVYMRSVNVSSTGAADGNSLVFSGKINVLTTPSSIGSSVGRYSNNNLLKFSNGVNATLAGDNFLGWNAAQSFNGNQIVVDRATLSIVDQTSGAGAAAKLRVGAHGNNNTVLVEGAGALLSVNNTKDASTTIVIGFSGATSGSKLTVRDGGTVKSSHGAQINVSTLDRFSNGLVIGPGGAFVSGGNIGNGGLIQLADTGGLRGENIANGVAKAITLSVQNGARFEVAGAGLSSTVTTQVQSGGTFAVGLTGSGAASVFTQSSSITLQTGSTLELSIFGANSVSSIDFSGGGTLTIQSGVTLRLISQGYGFVGGESYQLFTGSIASQFIGEELGAPQLPALPGGLTWDLSRFNQGGNWTISVIPEPRSTALGMAAVGVIAVLVGHRRRR